MAVFRRSPFEFVLPTKKTLYKSSYCCKSNTFLHYTVDFTVKIQYNQNKIIAISSRPMFLQTGVEIIDKDYSLC